MTNKSYFAPALTLMFMAPLLAEVLPGATRFSSMFVFPIEVCVWGGGALLIRQAFRKWQLGWVNLLLLALALSAAEEFLIQQTSLAPMVIRIKGEVYARAWDVNWVYLTWALIYESVFVVFLPVCLTELLFADRKAEPWLGHLGIVVTGFLFIIGSVLAWFTWTHIARTKVFHVPAYTPPLIQILLSIGVIGLLLFLALGPRRKNLTRVAGALSPPKILMLFFAGSLWAILLYGLVLLGFGISPGFPPLIAILAGCLLAGGAIFFVPKWVGSPLWQDRHTFSIISGTLLGAMLAGFIGFIGAAPSDLYFKIIVNLIAVVLMAGLGVRIFREERHIQYHDKER